MSLFWHIAGQTITDPPHASLWACNSRVVSLFGASPHHKFHRCGKDSEGESRCTFNSAMIWQTCFFLIYTVYTFFLEHPFRTAFSCIDSWMWFVYSDITLYAVAQMQAKAKTQTNSFSFFKLICFPLCCVDCSVLCTMLGVTLYK